MNPGARPPWGWIEWVILLQTALPALLFVPGLSAVRPLVRVSAFLVGGLAWVMIFRQGKSTAAATSFPARYWLIGAGVWLLMLLAHPNIYSIPAAVGQIALYFTVFSPAFWGGEALKSPRQLNRIMAILFLCNALSAAVGMAQVFSERFNPPVIPHATNMFDGENVKIEVDGRRIFRPCGLTDSPGAAAPAGGVAALIGLSFALRPIGVVRRLFCAGLAFIGVAVIYYTQVRSVLLVLALSLIVMTVMLGLQGRVGNALTLVLGSVGMLVASLLWVARRMGNVVFERFGALWSADLGNTIQSNRGGFVRQAFTETIWQQPLGFGLGWWGMVNVLFALPSKMTTVWVEIMIAGWITDGGIPLLVLYGGAVLAALYDSVRIALTSRDGDVSFWAAVVVAQNFSTVTLCFSFPAFVAPIGLQYWLLSAVIHAADTQARARSGRPAGVAATRPRRNVLRPRPWPPGQAAS